VRTYSGTAQRAAFAATALLVGSMALSSTALAGEPRPYGGGDTVDHPPSTAANDAANALKEALVQSEAGIDSLFPASYTVSTYARQQNNDYYCGPAAGQAIVNRTRGIFSSNTDGENAASNHVKQSILGSYMGVTTQGTSAEQLVSGLNHYANLSHTGTYLPFSWIGTTTGAMWHNRIQIATYSWTRGLAAPVKMTTGSYHLASWINSPTWWQQHPTVKHWLVGRGNNGAWDGTTGPQVRYNDSAGGYGGQTGNFVDSSLRMYELNKWHTARVVW
jgi:hypothetical protein